MLSTLLTLSQRYLARTIRQRFTVRIHSGIVETGRAWAKLWYLFRALDIQGSGYCHLKLTTVCQLLSVSSSTVRQWLREGKLAGAFRRWWIRGQSLRVAMTSLHRLCLHLKLGSLGWGTTAEIFLTDLPLLKPLATAATTQREQQISRHAAWRSLPTRALRHQYKLPQPADFFGDKARPFDVSAKRGIRCLIHVGKKRIFVSKGFIPFGTTQKTIAFERNISDRTVRRHINLAGIEHRQIVQAKSAYRDIRQALYWDSPGIAPEPNISLSRGVTGVAVLTEAPGRVGKPHSQIVTHDRFFNYGEKDWIYRCNLYRPELKLCSMRRSILNYKVLLEKSRVGQVDHFKNGSTGGR